MKTAIKSIEIRIGDDTLAGMVFSDIAAPMVSKKDASQVLPILRSLHNLFGDEAIYILNDVTFVSFDKTNKGFLFRKEKYKPLTKLIKNDKAKFRFKNFLNFKTSRRKRLP